MQVGNLKPGNSFLLLLSPQIEISSYYHGSNSFFIMNVHIFATRQKKITLLSNISTSKTISKTIYCSGYNVSSKILLVWGAIL